MCCFTAELTNVLERRIDSCIISVYPSLNPDHETLTIPADMLAKFGISAKISKDGIAFNNADIVFHYQEALRDVHYTNFKPAYYLNRQFKLVCSEMNGRFLSNEYIQTVSHMVFSLFLFVGFFLCATLQFTVLVDCGSSKIPYHYLYYYNTSPNNYIARCFISG